MGVFRPGRYGVASPVECSGKTIVYMIPRPKHSGEICIRTVHCFAFRTACAVGSSSAENPQSPDSLPGHMQGMRKRTCDREQKLPNPLPCLISALMLCDLAHLMPLLFVRCRSNMYIASSALPQRGDSSSFLVFSPSKKDCPRAAPL